MADKPRINSKILASNHKGGRKVQIAVLKKARDSKPAGSK